MFILIWVHSDNFFFIFSLFLVSWWKKSGEQKSSEQKFGKNLRIKCSENKSLGNKSLRSKSPGRKSLRNKSPRNKSLAVRLRCACGFQNLVGTSVLYGGQNLPPPWLEYGYGGCQNLVGISPHVPMPTRAPDLPESSGRWQRIVRPVVIRQLFGSCQAVVSKLFGSCQAVVRQLSGSCLAVVRQLSESHWLVYRHSLDIQHFVINCTHKNQL